MVNSGRLSWKEMAWNNVCSKGKASALLMSCGYIFAANQAIKSFRRRQSSNLGQVLLIIKS